jgi:diaminobutyrate-2-oxoglutarate transaminase
MEQTKGIRIRKAAALETFAENESNVRSYCRSFPTLFTQARGARLQDADGRTYIDFLAGAGALNYGHNEPHLKRALIDYIESDGITHGLDLSTRAKARFLDTFRRLVLEPRGLEYRVMFPGPTGTNSVEAALKLVRKVTGRENVVSFTNAFHGMTLGALALTGNGGKRAAAGVGLPSTTIVPFDGYLGPDVDTLDYLEAMLDDPSSGIDTPAAFIVETIQAEGGLNVASAAWLRGLEKMARARDILLIVDDIQVGCGRTGPFFSFEQIGLEPDVVCLSKSLSAYGLPMSVTLIRPELDVWDPGEHNGTFRGNNHAFVTAAAALERYWSDADLSGRVSAKAELVTTALSALADAYGGELRGRGFIQGVAFDDPTLAARTSREAFARGLVVETSGPRDEVLKILPPLIIDRATLEEGLAIIETSAAAADSGEPVGNATPARLARDTSRTPCIEAAMEG